MFYPDIVDKSEPPRFYLENTDHPDFIIIRFHGGAPYEDISFKILNKEWDNADRFGFRSDFEKGILRLYFKFLKKKYRK